MAGVAMAEYRNVMVRNPKIRGYPGGGSCMSCVYGGDGVRDPSIFGLMLGGGGGAAGQLFLCRNNIYLK